MRKQKPDPEALLAALSDLGVMNDDLAVIIGDSAADVLAGRAAGIATIGVLWGSPDHDSLNASAPHAICASVGELRSLLGLEIGRTGD